MKEGLNLFAFAFLLFLDMEGLSPEFASVSGACLAWVLNLEVWALMFFSAFSAWASSDALQSSRQVLDCVSDNSVNHNWLHC